MLVRIKTWVEMEKEFGLDEDGNIPLTSLLFVQRMELQMPEDRIIRVYKDKHFEKMWNSWAISDEMIAEIIEDDESPKNKLITSNDDLKVGTWYCCRSKIFGTIQFLQCESSVQGLKFLGSCIWADDSNNQALQQWDIIEAVVPKFGDE
jgi:hypothetical protein